MKKHTRAFLIIATVLLLGGIGSASGVIGEWFHWKTRYSSQQCPSGEDCVQVHTDGKIRHYDTAGNGRMVVEVSPSPSPVDDAKCVTVDHTKLTGFTVTTCSGGGGGGMAIGGTVTGASSGDILFTSSGNLAQNDDFHWNSSPESVTVPNIQSTGIGANSDFSDSIVEVENTLLVDGSMTCPTINGPTNFLDSATPLTTSQVLCASDHAASQWSACATGTGFGINGQPQFTLSNALGIGATEVVGLEDKNTLSADGTTKDQWSPLLHFRASSWNGSAAVTMRGYLGVETANAATPVETLWLSGGTGALGNPLVISHLLGAAFDGTNSYILMPGAKLGVDASHLNTLPTVNGDTFTLNAATQTLSNKTLSSATLTGTTTAEGLNASKDIGSGTFALTDGATINTDCSQANTFTVTVGGSRTFANPTNVTAGHDYQWQINSGAGSFSQTFSSNFHFPGGTAPTTTATASKLDLVSCKGAASNVLYCAFLGNYTP